MYPEFLIGPMREELTRYGVQELRSVADVDEALMNTPGTVMVVVNSVCGRDPVTGALVDEGWSMAGLPVETTAPPGGSYEELRKNLT